MKVDLPTGKRVAVNFGVDFDAHSCWMGSFNRTSPAYISRGEFDAEVGVPRRLETFARFDVAATFFTPGHTMATFPARFAQVLEAGRKIAAKVLPRVAARSRPRRGGRLMELQLESRPIPDRLPERKRHGH